MALSIIQNQLSKLSNPERYTMTRVAITGATGLLGHHLANHFIARGYQVFALINDERNLSFLNNNIVKISGNISNYKDVSNFINESQPDYVFHLAAQSQAMLSIMKPYETFSSNATGTLNILEAVRVYGKTSAMIVASSDKSYGELKSDSYREDHVLGGVYPYDASKSITDILVNSYRETYKMPLVSTRACNIYGIGDYNTMRIIPGILKAYKDNTVFNIRNAGKDKREYINVLDVVLAYETILNHILKDNKYSAFNIGSDEVLSTIDVFDLVVDCLPKSPEFRIEDSLSPEIRSQRLDSSRLKSLDWKPRYTMKSSIKDIVSWYLEA